MPSQVLITMDELETAVRVNAALEAAGLSTAMFLVAGRRPRLGAS
jgi:hypothetical protein